MIWSGDTRSTGKSRGGPPFRGPPLHFPHPRCPRSTQLAELRDSGTTDEIPFPIYTLLIIKSLSLCFPYMEYQSQRHREELFFMSVCSCLSTFSKRERLFFCLCDLNFKFSFDMEQWHQECREIKRGPPFQRAPPTPPLPPPHLLTHLVPSAPMKSGYVSYMWLCFGYVKKRPTIPLFPSMSYFLLFILCHGSRSVIYKFGFS